VKSLTRPWLPPRSAFTGFRFPADVIVVAVRWYLRFGLSYRDVEELLDERGVEVDHVTVYRWVQRFTPLLLDAARFGRHSPGDRWFVDETYVKVNGVWRYVYRAIDQHGQVIDVLLSARRDAAAARGFFRRALSTLKVKPVEVITDAAPVYPAVPDEVVPSAWHQVKQRSDRNPPGINRVCRSANATAPLRWRFVMQRRGGWPSRPAAVGGSFRARRTGVCALSSRTRPAACSGP
jgi:transposase-like protein